MLKNPSLNFSFSQISISSWVCLSFSFRRGVRPVDNTTKPYRKEGNVLFNDALNTFYLRLYGVRHMVEDHSDSERGNPLPPHGLLFAISSKMFFYMHHPTDRITHTTAFVTPVVGHWPERQNDNDTTRPQRCITHRHFGYQLYGGWTTGSFRRIPL